MPKNIETEQLILSQYLNAALTPLLPEINDIVCDYTFELHIVQERNEVDKYPTATESPIIKIINNFQYVLLQESEKIKIICGSNKVVVDCVLFRDSEGEELLSKNTLENQYTELVSEYTNLSELREKNNNKLEKYSSRLSVLATKCQENKKMYSAEYAKYSSKYCNSADMECNYGLQCGKTAKKLEQIANKMCNDYLHITDFAVFKDYYYFLNANGALAVYDSKSNSVRQLNEEPNKERVKMEIYNDHLYVIRIYVIRVSVCIYDPASLDVLYNKDLFIVNLCAHIQISNNKIYFFCNNAIHTYNIRIKNYKPYITKFIIAKTLLNSTITSENKFVNKYNQLSMITKNKYIKFNCLTGALLNEYAIIEFIDKSYRIIYANDTAIWLVKKLNILKFQNEYSI